MCCHGSSSGGTKRYAEVCRGMQRCAEVRYHSRRRSRVARVLLVFAAGSPRASRAAACSFVDSIPVVASSSCTFGRRRRRHNPRRSGPSCLRLVYICCMDYPRPDVLRLDVTASQTWLVHQPAPWQWRWQRWQRWRRWRQWRRQRADWLGAAAGALTSCRAPECVHGGREPAATGRQSAAQALFFVFCDDCHTRAMLGQALLPLSSGLAVRRKRGCRLPRCRLGAGPRERSGSEQHCLPAARTATATLTALLPSPLLLFLSRPSASLPPPLPPHVSSLRTSPPPPLSLPRGDPCE